MKAPTWRSCENVATCYSGVIGDYLALGRPIALYPFDRATYLAHRKLYVPYDTLDFAPMFYETDALVRHITSEALDQLLATSVAPDAELRRAG